MSIKSFKSFDTVNENNDMKDRNDNYMFFANLQHIVRMASEIQDMDESKIDEMLTDGHDWANDHISKSMESIEHVYNFLLSSMEEENEVEGMEESEEEVESQDVLDEMESELDEMEEELDEMENESIKRFNQF